MKKIQLTLEKTDVGHQLILYKDDGQPLKKGKWGENEKVEFSPEFPHLVEYCKQWLELGGKMLK